MKLLCKKSEFLSVDSEIFEGEWYSVNLHKGWRCPYIIGKGINGYSWIEYNPDEGRQFC